LRTRSVFEICPYFSFAPLRLLRRLTDVLKGVEMQIALRRSYATAGVALVGAGVIAVSPIAPPVPDLHLPSLRAPAVELTALPSWLQWVNDGTANVEAQIGAVVALIQSEIADPLPVLSQFVQNQIANGQRLADAFTVSGGIVAGTVAGLPAVLLNAISDAIDDPSQIPVIVSTLVQGLVEAGALAAATVINAVTDVVTTTVTRAVGVASALVSNVAPITLAALNAPFEIGQTVINSGIAVLAAAATLNPLNVISALGEGAVAVEAEMFNQASNFVNALGDLRDDVLSAMSVPLPPAPIMAARASAPEALPVAAKTTVTVTTGSDDGSQTGGTAIDAVDGAVATGTTEGGAADVDGSVNNADPDGTVTAVNGDETATTEVKKLQRDPYRPLKLAVARTERMAAQVINSTLKVAGVTLTAQGRVASSAVTGAGRVASTAVSGGDVGKAVSAARADVEAKSSEGRAAAREATTKAGDDLAQASKGKETQAAAASKDSSAGASASDG
jgi:hypothetical protein